LPIDDNLDEALRTARREFANAAELDRARSACDRAQQCVTRAEQELQRFAPLDPEISEWTAAQVRDDLDEPMPHHLLVAQGDRAAATDRLNHADRAQQRLAAGLRHCEANAQIAEKRLKAIARACLMVGAKAVAVELAEVQSRALSLQKQFMSLAQSSLPGRNSSAAALPPSVIRAINGPVPQRKPALVEQWQDRHRALVAGAEA
jgi:hypothetical protein